MIHINSILRYPGGKSRAVNILKDYFPKELDALVSPFFGGGSLEFYFANKGVKIYGYDLFEPLVNFWNELKFNKDNLVKNVKELHPMSKEQFKNYQKQLLDIENKSISAAIFFALNRASFSGSTLSGGMSPHHPRFNDSSIKRLNDFNMYDTTVKKLTFEESISIHNNEFLYLDPPYYIKNNLYGIKGDLHKNFDHNKLYCMLKKRKNWILSYNNCDEIRELYSGFEIVTPKWKYGMSNEKESKEMLIINY